MKGFKQPDALDMEGNLSDNWEKWKKEFKFFLLASESNAKADEVKTSMMLSSIGARAREVYYNFEFDAGEELKLNIVIDRFDNYFKPKKNVTFQRYKFFTTSQKEGQKFDEFLTELRSKANNCEFEKLKESLIKDILIVGITDKQVQERLLREPEPLLLDRAIEICRSAEQTKNQMEIMHLQPTVDVNYVSKKHQRGYQNKSQDNNSYKSETLAVIKKCYFCGRSHKIRECPAYGKYCRNCNQKNHFADVCKSKQINQINPLTDSIDSYENIDETSESVSNLFVNSVENKNVRSKCIPSNTWQTTIKVNNSYENFKLDTGSQVNIISASKYESLKSKPALRKNNTNLTAYNGTPIPTLGKCLVNLKKNGQVYREEVIVAKHDCNSILGLSTCVKMNLIKKVDEVSSKGDSIKDYGISNDIFGELGCLEREHHLTLKEGVTPVVHAPRRVPEALKDPLKKELERMERLEVIRKVEEPTEWVSSLTVAKKSNGKLRVCLDPKDLNKALLRSHYQMPTTEEIFSRMAGAKIFSKLDASSGYWQIKLDDSSAKLTTFNTPFGRYCFLRLPFGILSASEIFQREIGSILEGIEGQAHAQDDIIIWGRNEKEHEERLQNVVKAIEKSGLKLNKAKCQFGLSEVTYLGHKLTSDGIKADEDKIKAIKDYPHPKNKEELQRFLGMTNYLAKFVPTYSSVSAPLRKLLEKDVMWHWNESHVKSTDQLKTMITESGVLKFYDPLKEIKISTDASSFGIGSVILQKHDTSWFPVAFASRSLGKSEMNYAQIEKECLAIYFAVTKFHQYIYGKSFIVETDHKPLVPIFKKPLVNAPPRIQRMLLNLQKYDIQVEYCPGKNLVVADALSRTGNAPVDLTLEQQIDCEVCEIMNDLPMSERAFKEFIDETRKDEVLQKVIQCIKYGWNYDTHSELILKPYSIIQDELWEFQGLLWKADRVVVPKSMRRKLKLLIHEGHLGMEKCKLRARQSFYWPQMNSEIEDMISKCESCQIYKNKQQREPLKPHEMSRVPFEKVGMDLFSLKGHDYVVITDYFSNFPEVCHLNNTNSKELLQKTKACFARFGIPKVIISDGGPQFRSFEFKQFCREWDIVHIMSSPYYPKSNGQAERTVQTIKRLFLKCFLAKEDPYLALLAHRSTPMGAGQSSPAELLMGRRLRTKVPETNRSVIINRKKWEGQGSNEASYNLRTKPMPPLLENDIVRMDDGKIWTEKACVQANVGPRSYKVITENGKSFIRNRKHLRLTNERYIPKLASTLGEEIPIRNCSNQDYYPSVPRQSVVDLNEQCIGSIPMADSNKRETEKVLENLPEDGSVVTRSGRIIKSPDKLML